MVKLIGIPALGLLIPNLSGLISNRLYSITELVACYLFFITVAFLVWEGNVRLMYFIRARYPWTKKIILQDHYLAVFRQHRLLRVRFLRPDQALVLLLARNPDRQ